ncbi:MAG: MotA/TolQ/ExbB proton channel family protein [Lentisphaeria bacterium]|nr:MotA/TolQ/ExbB proton channel family protein [Lentisphaeria bacterium]
MTFWKFIVAGGPVLWVILFCSTASLFIFLSKWYEFHRSKVDIRELVTGLINVLRRDGFIEAITLCDNTPGPVAKILASGIKAYQNDEDIRGAIDEAAYFEIPRLESRLSILATIAKISPMLGLLGTVIGMGETFFTMQDKQGLSITLAELSGGVSVALSLTGAGLCVSIAAYIAYNYLVWRVEGFCLEMEKAKEELIYFFQHRENTHNGVKDAGKGQTP